jgi:hypothetical protein
MSKVQNVWADQKPARGAHPPLRIYIRNVREAVDKRDGLSHSAQLMVFGIILVALFSRCPSLFIHAQFYAEDGTVWYAQAYNSGWVQSLLIPQAGYLQTLPRLGAGLALLAPLRHAPLVMALIGALIQVLPAMILFSERCRTWAPLSTRVLFATVYVALPNAKEVHVVLTNSQWHIALVGVLLAFAAPPKGWAGHFFDCLLFAVGGFSGPFFIVLAPLVLIYWGSRRRSWSLAILAVMSIGAVTQIMVLVFGGLRVRKDLGANLDLFLRMIGGDIVAGSLFGSHGYALRSPMFLIVPAAFCWFAICLYCVRWANLELKLFVVYCAALLAASLRSPYVAGPKPIWEELAGDTAARYWFLPMLAFVWSSIWCARYAANRLLSIPSTAILLLMIIGIVVDFRYRPFHDEHFLQYARYVQDAPPGTHITIPIVPDGWKMELVKRGNSR